VYAANHGCKIIRLSCGRNGHALGLSEQDIINYAVLSKGSVVIIMAAAGNTNGELDFYPASYDNVLSVGMTDPRET